jgi:putative methionine-R-sulfoxide reductase with GAF domain
MLLTQHGIPPHVLPMLLPKIDNIPFGKGIAGCAAQRKEAVQLCNLQEDLGGVAKPDARKTNVQGALAVPIVGADGKVKNRTSGEVEIKDLQKIVDDALAG